MLNLNIKNRVEHRCRLKYNCHLNRLNFAIFKYSSESYDSEEISFLDAELVDRTIKKSTMRARIEIYRLL